MRYRIIDILAPSQLDWILPVIHLVSRLPHQSELFHPVDLVCQILLRETSLGAELDKLPGVYAIVLSIL